MRIQKIVSVSILLFLFVSTSIRAEEHLVKLLTTASNGETMVFEPGFLQVSVGDTIVFEPADASHNAESFFAPTSDANFYTELGVTESIVMTQEGIYLYKCTPHFMLGMIGVIQVGEALNKVEALAAWDERKEALVMNQDRMDIYLKQIK
tara:strand:+ start:333 stop:782 length:450 start_codon:yes stop_codon:yes gene_type:complete